MAHLVRQQKTYYVDADGRRIPKGTKGARKVREKSSKWYGVGIPGLPPKKRVPLATDKTAARRMLDDLIRRAEKGHVGLLSPDAARRPLADYLTAFGSDVGLGLASRSGRKARVPSPTQTHLVVQRVTDLLAGCGIEYPPDLNGDAPAKVARYLQNRTGLPRGAGGLSAQSAEFFLADGRRFVRWLAKRAPVRPDLLDEVPGFDPNNNRVHARREIAPAELAAVLDAARSSLRPSYRLTGEDRYHLYLTAFATGLRAKELASLLPASFDLDADPPAVVLPGKSTKNKKSVRQLLPIGVAAQLRLYLRSRLANCPVWPSGSGKGGWHRHAAEMLQGDLAAAGVPYAVEGSSGPEYADFHALRHSFVSALAAAGAGVKELQELARHGDPRLTLGVYTHARPAELARTLSRLALPGAGPSNPLAVVSRDDLESLVVGLLAVVGTVFAPSVVTPRVTPDAASTGDGMRPTGTKGRRRAVA